jgi:hypothetical protein
MIFVGYMPGSATYRCYDPDTRRVHINKDVIFDEEADGIGQEMQLSSLS